uniref:Uncharacterized protein n=1 Tax=Rhodosorus marinus TaxID=101924 RepID=A0A7S2ZM53_9RHOD|mmetsp:Transcript_24520/g.96810  ORF Transcript_24520/g.96810 Transcript_24520/m.96810 type:complete len:185 (+) Transcript_24520:509-1063(+)
MEDERGSEDGSTMVESAEMKRTDTMELLKKLKVTVGKDAASIHDHPKIKTLISEEEVAMYSKTICSNPNAHFNEPSKLSDWCDVSVTRSPLAEDKKSASFISPNETILVDVISHTKHTTVSREFLRAGPRELIAMDPRHVKVCSNQSHSFRLARAQWRSHILAQVIALSAIRRLLSPAEGFVPD